MIITAAVFQWLCIVTGCIALFGAMLSGLAWSLGYVLKQLKVWHILMLLLGIQRHGRNFRDRLFWEAVEAHINKSEFAAMTVANFAKRCAPFDEETSL